MNADLFKAGVPAKTLFAAIGGVNRRVAELAVVVGVAVLALNLYAPAGPTALQRLMASLILCLCSAPTLMWASDRDWGHSVMPLVGVTYGLYFGAPVFLQHDFHGWWLGSPSIDDSLIDLALQLALAGWALLLAAHFGPHRRRPAPAFPRVEFVPARMHRHAASLAVVIGLAAAPFFYLHVYHVVATYNGDGDGLPSAIAFPINLAGQFVVLSILILFRLHLRGRLGPAGRSFLWSLVVYYTVLGLSSGLVMEGMGAIIALFVAWMVTAPAPTWKGMAYGALAAAVLLAVLLPLRHQYRSIIWTHGVGASITQRISVHNFTLPIPGDSGAERGEPIVETPDYAIYNHEDRILTYHYNDAEACGADPSGGGRPSFFVHVYPVDRADLPGHRSAHSFDNFDFGLQGGVVADGRCVHPVALPAYAIDRIRTGLKIRPAFQHLHPDCEAVEYVSGVVADASRWRSRTLTAFVAGSYRNVDSDEEWQLGTMDATSWEIRTESGRTDTFRLIVHGRDEAERTALASVAPPCDRIRVEVDADNWAEYYVNEALVGESHRRVVYRLRALVASRGDRSALREGGPSATLFYPIIPGGVRPVVTRANETRDSPGRNPNAPLADASLMSKAGAFVRMIPGFVTRGTISSHVDNALNTVSERLNMLLPVAWVIHQAPGNVPYLRGETYYPVLFKLVPRFVWEGKPREVQDLGQRYGFLHEGNEINGFKIHHVGEMYANFGALGVLLGMPLLGALYRAVYRTFFHDDASAVTTAAGAHILTVWLMGMEDRVSGLLGWALWYVGLLALLGAVLRIALRLGGGSAHARRLNTLDVFGDVRQPGSR